MKQTSIIAKDNNETLDPKNWSEYRELGYQIVDDIIDYLENVQHRKVWKPIPPELKKKFKTEVPFESKSASNVYQEFKDVIFDYPYGNIHPRFWAWINSPGTMMGILGSALGATLNSNCIYGDHSAIYVEAQVLSWLKQILGLNSDYSGVLVSGGSMANLYGLTVARNSFNQTSIRKEGLKRYPQLAVYCSTETHNSIDKAVEHLGIGHEHLRRIPVNEDYTINLSLLKDAIKNDRKTGLQPLCIVANAGTVNTGAIDPLNDIADFCKKEGTWMHVDGAYGLFANLVESQKRKLKGFERADSVCVDLHKWLYVNYGVGCIFFKSKEKHVNAFNREADYLMKHERGLKIEGGPIEFNDLGLELSRPNRALKVWMSIKEHGISKYKRMIKKDIELANYLVQKVNENPSLELMAPVNLSIVCFRYNPGGISLEKLNWLNKEILMDLQESGEAIISSTMLNGHYVLRASLTNHRSKTNDIDHLIRFVVNISKRIQRGQRIV